jgi:hypothetical protein
VRDLPDAVEGFRRIAQSRSAFVANNSGIPKYTEDLLWEAAGRPSKQGWYVDLGLREQGAVQVAAERGAYTIWGLVPFLRYLQQNPVDLRPLLVSDAVLSRMMVSVVLRPEKFPQANVEGAKALEKYLLVPSTQARIRAFRTPGLDHALWWPSARENTTAALGYGPEGAVGAQPAPAISPGGVVNAVDRSSGIRPGSIVEIYGTNFAVGTCSADTLPGPTQLPCSPTRVSVSGRDSPLLYISPLQINAQIPPALSPGSVTVTVIRGPVQSNAVAVTLVP